MRDDALRAAACDGPCGKEEEGLAAIALQAEETAVVRRAVVPSGARAETQPELSQGLDSGGQEWVNVEASHEILARVGDRIACTARH